ncbi:MAG: hypothetical protein US67_C0002G0021 [Candidatus Woesebacteria bacterium GW2011_GWD1_38_10]|uniref:Uncharacterized protein n=1 Tax=Candidatus Woesebacteria bacterium GW2011_GWD1_38_10 TaxID=1618592 RepID=A0A0G0I5Y2_9BACT|nr:MAG: hypothetical protein US67_C0002G0021 [Candidatus Woesebacteria bacterium GW2011_GWD1_38_10]
MLNKEVSVFIYIREPGTSLRLATQVDRSRFETQEGAVLYLPGYLNEPLLHLRITK